MPLSSTLDYNPDSVTDFNFDFNFDCNFDLILNLTLTLFLIFSYTSTHSREARLKKILESGKSVGIVPMSDSYSDSEGGELEEVQ